MRDLSSLQVAFYHNGEYRYREATYGDKWESNQFLLRLRGWSGHQSIGELRRIEVHLEGTRKIKNNSYAILQTTEGYRIKVSLGPLRIQVEHRGYENQWHPTDDEYRCMMILLRHFADGIIRTEKVEEQQWVQ